MLPPSLLTLECEPGDGIIHVNREKDGRLGLKSNDGRMLEMTEAEFEALVQKRVDERVYDACESRDILKEYFKMLERELV